MANSCKFYKQQKQVSMNSGQTWQDVTPFEYRRGDIIERDSEDCREGTLISRWVTIPDAFICEGRNKYEKMVGQYSLDNGSTWDFYNPSIYQKGLLLETNSQLCHNKWEGHYFTDGDLQCPDGYRYVIGRGCVYAGRPVDPVKYIRCASSSSTTLTDNDIRYNPYYLYEGIVGDCVTEIGEGAFDQQLMLSSITISNTVSVIGNDAFNHCISLKEVTLPSTFVTLKGGNRGSHIEPIIGGAFRGCSGLTSIIINEGVIEDNVFSGCTSLSNITLGTGVTSFGSSAFDGCSSLTGITIPSTMTGIGSRTFYGCTSLKSVVIPSNIVRVGNYAFYGCSGLTSITFLSTTPPIANYDVFDGSTCPIYVPAQSVEAYKSSGWREYANRIQPIT